MMHQTDRDRLYRYLGFASSGTETTMTRSEARMFRPPHPERTARRPMPGGDVRFREFEDWGHVTEADIVKAALEYLDTEAVQTETCPACRRVVPRLVESPDDPYSVCQGCRDEIAGS